MSDPSKCDASVTCDDCGEAVTYDIRRPGDARCRHCDNTEKRHGRPVADTENSFRTRAQARKAATIVAWIRSGSVLADDPERVAQVVAGMIDHDSWWQAAAEAAGVNAAEPPSHTTRAMVLGLLDMHTGLKLPEVIR